MDHVHGKRTKKKSQKLKVSEKIYEQFEVFFYLLLILRNEEIIY